MKVLLIGMPGCGKSTIGSKLAVKLKLNFIDMDQYIEEKYNKKIDEIFMESEETFRNYETEVCAELSKEDDVVIASGGGIILRKNNMDYFRDFEIVFINRDLDILANRVDHKNRPLLSDNKNKIYNIYNKRIELYKHYADYCVDNNHDIDSTVKVIKRILGGYVYENKGN